LLIAYACEPGRGSEWGTSWAFVHELAQHQPVWLIAHADNRERLDARLAAAPLPNPVRVTYVELPRWLGWMRNSNYALLNVHYYFWQWRAGRIAQRLHAQERFDVAQHVSFSRWWMPSAGAAIARRGVKFIFGPCVGGELMPKHFSNDVPAAARWGEFQRWVARTMWTHDPRLARCIGDASIVVAGTPSSIAGVTKLGAKRVEVLPSVMITDTTLIDAARPVRAARKVDATLRLVSVGGMVYHRGIDLILRALAASGIKDFHYTHCCGGVTLDAMKKLAAELGIADRVTFTGETKHAENLHYVAKADALLHLVLRDSQGVVPEALALGVPVMALDHHSMTPILDERTGHKVPMNGATQESVVADVARTLRLWAENRDLLKPMAQACVARSAELSPAHRVGLFRKWYAELTSEVPAKRAASPIAQAA
jgi:glycosyltransferase involved in cell wall biosynthesis